MGHVRHDSAPEPDRPARRSQGGCRGAVGLWGSSRVASIAYGGHKLAKEVNDYTPGPIASPTGPVNLHSTLAGAPDAFAVEHSSDLGVVGRVGLTGDFLGASAQVYSGQFRGLSLKNKG